MIPTRQRLVSAILLFYGLSVVMALGFLASRSAWVDRVRSKTRAGSVAVLHIQGAIQGSVSSSWSKQDADDLARQLHKWSEDDDIKVILLRINSPGGTVGGVQEIYREVIRCKAKGKKIVASLGDVAASGGYYLAASADKIVANPGTITGSIGVILQFGNLEGLFEKVGVRLQVVKSGTHKDIGSPARALTPEERRMLQASIDDAYDQFVDAVATGRSMPREKVVPLADGRIFTGREAQKAGLVDALGNKEDALEIARDIAHLSPKSPVVSDRTKSLRSVVGQMSSRLGLSFWDAMQDTPFSFRLEYSLR